MNNLHNIFQTTKQSQQGVFMAGIVPGYPNLKTSFEIAKTIIKAGADILELSASFSDPVADGPTLQQAHAKVLQQGINKTQIFQLYKQIRNFSHSTPLFVIEYVNCVYHPGINNYYKNLADSGVDSLLIPDLSLEEAGPFLQAAQEYNINQVFIVAPTTPKERLIQISKASSGFLYLVTITGVTGQRESFLEETVELIQKVKQVTNIPLIAGFGISKPQHVQQALSSGADGAVTCSAIINLINQHLNQEQVMLERLSNYIQEMKQSTQD